MSVAAMAFLYMAIATSSAAIAFLVGQRSSGRTSKEVQDCYEHALLLESIEKDLHRLHEEATTSGATDGREDLAHARASLDEAVVGLRRGADLVV